MNRIRVGVICRVLWPSGPTLNSICQVASLQQRFDAQLVVLRVGDYKYHYQDLIEKHKVSVNVLRRRIYDLLRAVSALTLPMLPKQRSLESTVDVPLLLAWPFLDKSNYDVIVCSDQWAALSGLLFSTIFHKRFIVNIHDPLAGPDENYRLLRIGRTKIFRWLLARTFRLYERLVIERASSVVVDSEKTRKQLSAVHGESVDRKCKVIYPCFFGTMPREKRKPRNYILSVSRWEKERNPSFAIDLAKSLDVEIMLGGSWTPSSYLTEFLTFLKKSQPSLKGKVTVKINLNDKQLNELYLGARAYVQWNPENFSVGTARALLYGLPVISIQGVGATEIASPTQLLTIEKTSPEAFARGISSILSSPDHAVTVADVESRRDFISQQREILADLIESSAS